MPAFSAIYQSKLGRTLIPALAGFFGYGSWAFFCNFMHGIGMGLQSGLVQGSLSFVITLVSNFVMEGIYRLTQAKIVTILTASTLIVGTSYTVNTLAGTPEVLWTIAPGSIMGVVYVVSYVSALNKRSSTSSDTQT